MNEPDKDVEEPTSLQDLSRSFGAMLERQGEAADASPPEAAGVPEPARDPPSPLRIIEALLFVGGPPLTSARAAEIIRGLAPAQFHEAIDTLNQDYRRQGRPYAIVPQASGYVLTLRPRFRSV